MTHKKNTTNLTELLLQCVTQPDPMLSMLEWLCTELMEAEVDQQLGAEKSQRTGGRSGYRSGYRPRRLDTRMGTMYLMMPKVRQGGYSFRSSSQNASAVKPCLYRWFRKPSCRAFPLEKWRSWHIASALKIYPEARSTR